MDQLDMFNITADQARGMYADPAYVDAMQAITNAIIEAAPGKRMASVTVQTVESNPGYHAVEALKKRGFTASLIHDREEKTSSITVYW